MESNPWLFNILRQAVRHLNKWGVEPQLVSALSALADRAEGEWKEDNERRELTRKLPKDPDLRDHFLSLWAAVNENKRDIATLDSRTHRLETTAFD